MPPNLLPFDDWRAAVPRVAPYPLTPVSAWTVEPATAAALATLRALPAAPPTTTTTTQGRRALQQATATATDSVEACSASCGAAAGCGAAVYDGGTGNCTLAYLAEANDTAAALAFPACFGAAGAGAGALVQRSDGFCGLAASSGVLATGRRWQGWGAGAALGDWGSANRIETSLQGRAATSASDCLCFCLQSSTCAAYVFLGFEQVRVTRTRAAALPLEHARALSSAAAPSGSQAAAASSLAARVS